MATLKSGYKPGGTYTWPNNSINTPPYAIGNIAPIYWPQSPALYPSQAQKDALMANANSVLASYNQTYGYPKMTLLSGAMNPYNLNWEPRTFLILPVAEIVSGSGVVSTETSSIDLYLLFSQIGWYDPYGSTVPIKTPNPTKISKPPTFVGSKPSITLAVNEVTDEATRRIYGVISGAYEWFIDAGDGTTYKRLGNSFVDHTYSTSGTYLVKATATNAIGTTVVSQTTEVVIPTNPFPPYVIFSTTMYANLNTVFSNASTYAGQAEWDFGDGSSTALTTSRSVSHVYTAEGTYDVTLTMAGTSYTEPVTISYLASDYLWLDYFNDTGGTNLEDHLPSIGNTYTKEFSSLTMTINGNGAEVATGGDAQAKYITTDPLAVTGPLTVNWKLRKSTTAELSNGYFMLSLLEEPLSDAKLVTVIGPTSITMYEDDGISGSQYILISDFIWGTNLEIECSLTIDGSDVIFTVEDATTIINDTYTRVYANTFKNIRITTDRSNVQALSWTYLAAYQTTTPATGTPTRASFTEDSTGGGNAPLTVAFTDTSTGTGLTYLWDFGDGTTSTSASPTHIYTVAGNYNIVLTVTDTDGIIDQFKYLIVVTDPNSLPITEPLASFTASDTYGAAPLNVTFTDTSTGTPTSWAWVFGGDGTSASQSPTHEFTNAGNYDVTLTATNSNGSSIATQRISVWVTTDPHINPPVVVPSASPIISEPPSDITFSYTTSTPCSIVWDFGDGTTSVETSPTHTYTQAGLYTVTATGTNNYGFSTSTVLVLVDDNYVYQGEGTISYYILNRRTNSVWFQDNNGSVTKIIGGEGVVEGKFINIKTMAVSRPK